MWSGNGKKGIGVRDCEEDKGFGDWLDIGEEELEMLVFGIYCFYIIEVF